MTLTTPHAEPVRSTSLRPPPAGAVRMGGFWAARIDAVRGRTVDILFERCEAAGMFDQIDPARPVPEQRIPFSTAFGGGRIRPVGGNVTAQMYWDSDIAKVIEAASGCLASRRDAALEARIDAIVEMYAGLQLDDGYLNSWYIRMQPGLRWRNLRDCHELYCAGHMIEAAVAYFEATGKSRFLDLVCRYADHIAATFGTGPGQKPGYCGHEEIELALVRLARTTGEQRFMALARYFVDQRGQQPHYFDTEAVARAEAPENFTHKTYEYNQSHKPVRAQTKVVGHAVRAMYLASAMADLVTETGDAGLARALDAKWTDLTAHRLYVTGGLGPSQDNEGFTRDYDLPNESAYAETCASVGLVFWASRMLGARLDARYADAMEVALYNGALAGISLDGERFFYENPLESAGGHHRWQWHRCPCCPPNLARLVAGVGSVHYAVGDNRLALHLYGDSTLNVPMAGRSLTLGQRSDYPWDGRVALDIGLDGPARFTLALRVPGWCKGATLTVNGAAIDTGPITIDGYIHIDRDWENGDRVLLDLPMAAERLHAHPEVRQDRDRVALRRGPLVFTAEGTDNEAGLNQLILDADAEITASFEPGLLGGVVRLSAAAEAETTDGWRDALYRTAPPERRPATITAIPYFAWDNRAPGEMLVWLRSERRERS